MIGSRLLFSGYGIGFKSKPLHAGFLGLDTPLVHDEAHLEPPFQTLIQAIEDEQQQEPDPVTPGVRLKVMALTATPRGGEEPLRLTEADRSHPVVAQRIGAVKSLHLHPFADEKKLPDAALSHKDANRPVLVFARRVEVIEKVADRLRKAKAGPVASLTGTLRGKERDELVDSLTFKRFKPGAEPGIEAAYLVCTSAGEVGVNITADHLVCDLSTYERMAQRFGRINRFGDRDDSRIDVFLPEAFDEKTDPGARRGRTLELLGRLDGDGSPDALSRLDLADRISAFSPPPKLFDTSDILFDAWALTSIRDKLPGRPRWHRSSTGRKTPSSRGPPSAGDWRSA